MFIFLYCWQRQFFRGNYIGNNNMGIGDNGDKSNNCDNGDVGNNGDNINYCDWR